MLEFTLRSEITDISVIAIGRKIRDLRKIQKAFGKGGWRKLKGEALAALVGGEVVRAELHWYEAHGIGRRDMKIKRLLPR